MILIHTALLCEAQTFIDKYKLKKINSTPKVYLNKNIIILVSGIGGINTTNSLKYIFVNYKISSAINIGIAGCSDKSIIIGALFCTTNNIKNINYMKLATVDTPQIDISLGYTDYCLFDMEGSYFYDVCLKYLDSDHIYVLKVVSDHLNDTILSKEATKKLIYKSNINEIFISKLLSI